MNILKTNHNNLDELVFENRNKAYGAYVLRSDYNNTLIRSFLTTFLVPMAIIITSIIYNKLHGDVLVKNPLVEPPISDSITIVEYILSPKELIKDTEKAQTKPAGNNNNYEVKRNQETKPISFDSVARTNDLDLPIGPTNPTFNPVGKGTFPS